MQNGLKTCVKPATINPQKKTQATYSIVLVSVITLGTQFQRQGKQKGNKQMGLPKTKKLLKCKRNCHYNETIWGKENHNLIIG